MRIASSTGTDFLCFCPFHSNHDTPSFSISKRTGMYLCFNPACGMRGNVLTLLETKGNLSYFQAVRMMHAAGEEFDVNAELERMFEKPAEFEPFDTDVLARLEEAYWHSPAEEYMTRRDFTIETAKRFRLGWSEKMRMVTWPISAPNGMIIGIIGRSIEGKSFHNSKNMPRRLTLFNFSEARREGETVIVCESSFDAMKVHQAGFPNVVSTVGSQMTTEQLALLDRTFTKIIFMGDNDKAGRAAAEHIAKSLAHKDFWLACYDDTCMYPDNKKDPSDLTEQEIAQSLGNAKPLFDWVSFDFPTAQKQL